MYMHIILLRSSSQILGSFMENNERHFFSICWHERTVQSQGFSESCCKNLIQKRGTL